MNALVWRNEELGAQWDVVEIPADLKEAAVKYREQMIEAAVEIDDDAMEAYLNGDLPNNDTIRRLLRRGTIDAKFFLVFAGSAFKNKGVQPLLDGVIDFLPAPVTFRLFRASTPAPRLRSSVMRTTTSRWPCWHSRSPTTRIWVR